MNSITWKKYAVIMGLSLFGLVLLSWFRLWFIGVPYLDGLPMIIPWEVVRRTLFFALMMGVGMPFLILMRKDIDAGQLRSLFIASIILQIIAALTLPLTSNDIFSNLAYGKMMHLGLDANHAGVSLLPLADPFRMAVTPRWIDMPMVYGPVIGVMNWALTLPNSFWGSVVLYKAAALAVTLILSYIVYLFCDRRLEGCLKCNSFILFALNPMFIWELSSQAHNDSVMVLGVLAFVILLLSNKPTSSLLSLLFAIITKLAVLPVMGLYYCYTFFNSKKRFIIYFALAIGVTALLAVTFSEKFGMILAVPREGSFDASRLTGTPAFLVYHFLGGELSYKIYWLTAMAAMGLLGLNFAWRSRTKEKLFLHSFLFIFLFNLIATPTYQAWYPLWILPFILVIDDKKLRTFFAVYSVVSVAQYCVLNSITGGFFNIVVLAVFFYKFRSKVHSFLFDNARTL